MRAIDPQLIERVRGVSGKRVLLAFSCGKDSIAAFLGLREQFEILPFYQQLVPGLKFVEEYLDYFERWSGLKVARLVHPSFYRLLRNLVFQPPERCEWIENLRLRLTNFEDNQREAAEHFGCSAETLTAVGVRANDSIYRRLSIEKHGPINFKTRSFYPCYDWNKNDVVEAIEESGIRLPVDYKLFGRSFDGLDLRFLYPIRAHLPDDYAQILEWFPLAELEVKRYEYHQGKAAAARPI